MVEAKNILLVRTDRIGELVLTTPAMIAVREHFPRAVITAVVSPYSAEAVEGACFIDSIIKFDPMADCDNLLKKLKFFQLIKKSRFDLAVMFNPSKFFNILTFLAGIPIRVGYDRKAGFLLTHKIRDKKYLCDRHEVEYNLELIGTIGVKPADKSPYFHLDDSAEGRVSDMLKENGAAGAGEPLIAVHPDTSNPEKMLPPDRFARLCDKLLDEFKIKIVLIGGAGGRKIAGEVKSRMRGPVMDMTGALTIKELGPLLKRCSLLISNDSGPVHISAAVGTPTIVFFGEKRPGGSSRRWGAYGEGHLIIGKPRVADISVDEAYRAIRDRVSKLCKIR